jgi:WD40 repeat protein
MVAMGVIGVDALRPGDPGQVGAYRLLGRLGAGGMGQVFLGESPGGRKVAVKLLHEAHVADAEFRARFAREVAAARMVSGFYTAPVVDADPAASPPWMVTAYVAGPSLSAAVAERGPLGVAEAQRLGAALAEGLAAIHVCGLVHRDLKPSNIILADDGARIIDFGIARAVGASALTSTGTVIGTFAYMSPEQIMGRPVGAPSDIFALGAVLAYAATGRGPFDAETIPTITYRILSEPPDLTGLDGPLRDLIEDCLRKAPEQRPALGDLLTRLAALAREQVAPVVAPPVRAAPVVAPPVSGASQPPSGPAPEPPPAAVQEHWPPAPDSAVRGASLTSALLPGDGVPLANLAFAPDGRVLAGSALHGQAWRVYLWDVGTRQLAWPPIDGRGDAAPALAFSPDGRLLVVTDGAATQLRSTATFQPVILPASGNRDAAWKAVAFPPDGIEPGVIMATVTDVTRASGFARSQVRLWDVATLQPLGQPLKIDGVVSGADVRFSPGGRFLLAGTESDAFLCDVTAASPAFRKVRDHDGTARKSAFSADGQLLAMASAGTDGVRLLDTGSRAPVTHLDCGGAVARVTFSPVGPILATVVPGKEQSAIDVWAATAQPMVRRRLEGFPFPVASLRFSPDGQFIAAVSDVHRQFGTQHALIWHAVTAQPGGPLDLRGPVTLAFSPDSRFFAVSCADRTVRLWDMRFPGPPLILGSPGGFGPGSGPHRRRMAFSPDARLLATADQDGARLWDLPGTPMSRRSD